MCTLRGGSVCGSCSTYKHFFHGLGACDLCWLAVCPRLIPKRFSFMDLWYSILYSIANYELLRCLGYDKWHREVEWNFSRWQLKLCQKFCLKCVWAKVTSTATATLLPIWIFHDICHSLHATDTRFLFTDRCEWHSQLLNPFFFFLVQPAGPSIRLHDSRFPTDCYRVFFSFFQHIQHVNCENSICLSK